MSDVQEAPEWMGSLPRHWRLTPVGTLFDERKESVSDSEFPALSVTKGGVVPQLSDVAKSQNGDARKLVRAGDFVINSRSDRKGSSGISELDGSVSVVYTVLRPREGLDLNFAHHLLRSSAFQEEFYRWGSGIVADLWSTRYSAMKRIALPIPPLDEQRDIADYLDRETQKIDELITEQRGLIETLRERRRATISAAIQPHDLQGWERLPLRYAIQFQEGPGIGAADFRESGVPLLRISSIRGAVATLEGVNYLDPKTVDSRWSHFKVETGDLLINSSASMGSVAEVLDDEVVGSIPYTGIIRVRAGLMVKQFARWYFESDAFMHQIELLKTGSTIQHFGPMHLRQVRVSLPEQHRQLEIARNLDGQTSRIDELISESEDLIALSQERRAALITAAVTGQIDVRTAA